MKLNKKQMILAFIGIAVVIVLSVVGVLVQEKSSNLSFVLSVLGIVILLSVFFYIVIIRLGTKRQQTIARKDERNILINDKAMSMANSIIMVLLPLASIILLIFKVEYNIGQVLMFVAMLDLLIYTFSARYYDKRL